MVLVDTSIWINLYRKRSAEVGRRIWTLVGRNEAAICGQVWVEFLGGFRDLTRRRRHEENLRAYPFLDTPRKAYDIAVDLLASYPRLGAGDAIIAATAIANDAELWTADRDFDDLAADGLRLWA
jgi:predicted nucleic acid-binding protein